MEELLQNHGFHLQIIGLLIGLIAICIGALRMISRYHERRENDTANEVKTLRLETKENLDEVKIEVKSQTKDIAEIKQGMRHFVTRDEFQKGMDRAHGRIDRLELHIGLQQPRIRHRTHPRSSRRKSNKKIGTE